MRTLCKKALALCVVFALALTCFVGTLSVSAADPYNATIKVDNVAIDQGTTSADVVLDITVAEPGINEAIIIVTSDLGTINAEPVLVSSTATDGGKAILDWDGIADSTGDYSKFFLSAQKTEDATELNGITAAQIKLTFTVAADKAVGEYAINIATDGVKAADKNETVVNFVYEVANVTVVAPHVHNVVWTSDNAGNHTSSCDAEGCKGFEATTEACADEDANNICDKCGYAFPVVPEHEHHIVWESNDDATHTSKCDAEGCDETFVPATEDCADEDSNNACDKCGYDMSPDEQEPVYDASLAFKGKTALFESDYSLMYYVPVKLGTSWHIEVSREVYNKNTRLEDKKVTLTIDDVYSTTKPGDGNEYYLVALRGIATKEVANEIVAVLHNNVDGVDYYGAELSYNLVDYAVARMAKNIAKEVKYLQAFLNYAAACQVKFEYNTTDLANSVLSEEAKVVTLNGEITQNSDVKEYEVLEGATATLNGFAPSYEDKMTLGTICKVPDNYVEAGLKIRYSYVNSAGVTKNDYVSLADSKEYTQAAGYRLVMFTGLAIKEVRTPVLVTVVDANNNPISNTRQYSFEAYAAKQATTSKDYAPARAMVAFGDWFKVYKDN